MHIREFTGADFDPLSRLLGTARHSMHGTRSYWQGSDELCAHLAQADVGFVAELDAASDADGALVGVILVSSPRAQDHNRDLRMHWLQQRTRISAVANVLGIQARADLAQAGAGETSFSATGNSTAADDTGIIELFEVSCIASEQEPAQDATQCDAGEQEAFDQEATIQEVSLQLLRQAVLWLTEHEATSVRLSRAGEKRALPQEVATEAFEEVETGVWVAPAQELLALCDILERDAQEAKEAREARGACADSKTPELPILPNEPAHNDRIAALLDEYSAQHGVDFVPYEFHVEEDGKLVAGIKAWAMGPYVYIEMLAVDEEHRRQGLGDRLLRHVEEIARKDGCTIASVDTFSFQAPAYYPAHGYSEVYRKQLDDGSEHIFFSKRL